MNTQPQQSKTGLVVALSIAASILLIGPVVVPSLWFLILVGLVPLFFVVHLLDRKWGTVVPSAVGFIFACVIVYPLTTLNTWWWTVSNGLIWEFRELIFLLFGTGLALVGSILTFGVVFFVYSRWLKNRPGLSILILPTLWTVFEIGRVKILANLEWGIFGRFLGENTTFAGLAVFGIYALTFVAVIINFTIFLAVQSFLEKKYRRSAASAVLVVVIFALVIINGYFVGSRAGSRTEIAGKNILKVAVISPDLRTTETANEIGVEHIFDLISEAVSTTPNLIIFPENTFPTLILDEKTARPISETTNKQVKSDFDQLMAISAKNPAITFIIGLHTSVNSSANRFNSAIVIENGKIGSIYNKKSLLPFTERSFSFLEAAHIDPLQSGTGDETMTTRYGNIGPLICSELLVPRGSVKRKNLENTSFLVNLSNDNVFDNPRVAQYNKTFARLRAIEYNLPLIRSAKGGFSGGFDQTGQKMPSETLHGGEIILITPNIP